MNHGLTNSVLYAACKITVTFIHKDFGNEISTRGTCFFAQTKENHLCLITNRHVVDASFKQEDPQFRNYRIFRATVENHSMNAETGLPDIITHMDITNCRDFIFAPDLENDIACLFPIEIQNPPVEIAYSVPYGMIADEEWLHQRLSVCDFVGFPGFPDWYDKVNNSPIFRSGTIASDPRFNYSNVDAYTGNRIAYEAFSFGGSSGSPVFALQKGFPVGGAIQAGPNFYREVKMIGINGGHLYNEQVQHSGISYFYKSSCILEIMQIATDHT